MKTRTAAYERGRAGAHDGYAGGPRDHGRYWRGDDAGSWGTCSFCGASKPRAGMVSTADGPYCRQCWMDHWA